MHSAVGYTRVAEPRCSPWASLWLEGLTSSVDWEQMDSSSTHGRLDSALSAVSAPDCSAATSHINRLVLIHDHRIIHAAYWTFSHSYHSSFSELANYMLIKAHCYNESLQWSLQFMHILGYAHNVVLKIIISGSAVSWWPVAILHLWPWYHCLWYICKLF